MPTLCGFSHDANCIYWRSVYHTSVSFSKYGWQIVKSFAIWPPVMHTNLRFPTLKGAMNTCNKEPCNIQHPMMIENSTSGTITMTDLVVGTERIAGMYLSIVNQRLRTDNRSCSFGQHMHQTPYMKKEHGKSHY